MGQLITHVVCRSFGDDTIRDGDPLRRRLAGECVNAMGWRNVQGLERNRHVVPITDGLEPISDTYGRLWVDLDTLHKAEREVLPVTAPEPQGTGGFQVDPIISEVSGNVLVNSTDEVKISSGTGTTTVHYPDPVREGNPGRYTKYRLWDGSIVVGRDAALEAHTAGVNADLERRRLESSPEPAAGSDETNSEGPGDDERNDSEH